MNLNFLRKKIKFNLKNVDKSSEESSIKSFLRYVLLRDNDAYSLNSAYRYIFLCFILVITYITSIHYAEQRVRDVDRANKKLKELRWEYLSIKSDLMYISKQTEVAAKVKKLGFSSLIKPPVKVNTEDE